MRSRSSSSDYGLSSEPVPCRFIHLTEKMKATGDSPGSPAERKSTLIEFPGISRNALPEWRKELSERVREVQERRARETAHEAAEAERQRVEATADAPQLELLPPTETLALADVQSRSVVVRPSAVR